jgi:hypothetical protein
MFKLNRYRDRLFECFIIEVRLIDLNIDENSNLGAKCFSKKNVTSG